MFHRQLYPGLGLSKSVFFDRETFGEDRLVTGDPLLLGFDEFAPGQSRRPAHRCLSGRLPSLRRGAAGPVGAVCRHARLHGGHRRQRSSPPSPRPATAAFLTDICKLPADAADFFQGRSSDNFGYGIDAIGAVDAMGEGFPGAKALRIEDKTAGHAEEKAAYVHHFPDGNASLARALVRSLVVGVAPGRSMEDLVSAVFDYAELDRTGAAVRAAPAGDRGQGAQHADGSGVDVGYVKDGELRRVRARQRGGRHLRRP